MSTLEDIARATGVSRSTVSRVLNGRSTTVPISTETRRQVLAAAKELAYRPNLFARYLKTKRSHILGVAIRDFTNPFWGGLVQGIVEAADEKGYRAILSNMANAGEEEEAVNVLQEQLGVAGLLIVGDFPGDEATVEKILRESPTAVALCRYVDPSVAPLICVDDRQGITMMMEHLFDLGHRRIGFVGLAHPQGFADRHEAYHAFLASRGLCVPEDIVDLTDVGPTFPSGDRLVDLGAAAAARILERGEDIDAIVCACDNMAVGALRAVRDRRLNVPDDLAITGFDDVPLARFCRPPLTTIRQPVVDMGRAAAELLIRVIEGEGGSFTRSILFPPELIIRASTVRSVEGGTRDQGDERR